MSTDLQSTIEAAWDARETLGLTTTGAVRDAVEAALAGLDDGSFRVAERDAGGMWQVNQWLKKAVLLSFRLNDMEIIEGGAGGATWWDKVPSKFAVWGENRFRDAGFRAVFSGSPIKRIGRNRFVRNCLYAAGNSGLSELAPQVSALRADPDPVVADAADWAAARLR